jgi:hypothetical protein
MAKHLTLLALAVCGSFVVATSAVAQGAGGHAGAQHSAGGAGAAHAQSAGRTNTGPNSNASRGGSRVSPSKQGDQPEVNVDTKGGDTVGEPG